MCSTEFLAVFDVLNVCMRKTRPSWARLSVRIQYSLPGLQWNTFRKFAPILRPRANSGADYIIQKVYDVHCFDTKWMGQLIAADFFLLQFNQVEVCKGQ